MTEKQSQIYAVVSTFYKKHGYSPSASTLAIQFDMTHQGMLDHFDALIAKGYLKRPARGVVIPVDKTEAIHTPVLD